MADPDNYREVDADKTKFCRVFIATVNAQVAELVDALVSKTSEVTLVPVRSRPWVHFKMLSLILREAFFLCISSIYYTQPEQIPFIVVRQTILTIELKDIMLGKKV